MADSRGNNASGLDTVHCASGHANPAAAKFCSVCGQSLPTSRSEGDQPDPKDTPRNHDLDASSDANPVLAPAPDDEDPSHLDANITGTGHYRDSSVEEEASNGSGKHPTVLVIGTIGLAVVALGAFLLWRPSTEDRYLAALDERSLDDDFTTEREAVRNGERICENLEDGAAARGSRVDQVGVEFFCPHFFEDFRVLRTEEITGTFLLISSNSIDSSGNTCSGSGGYSDLSASTQVTVTNDAEETLARTRLGPGETLSTAGCLFKFSFEITEGEDSYVVSVGRRGEFAYSWDEITEEDAISFSMGG